MEIQISSGSDAGGDGSRPSLISTSRRQKLGPPAFLTKTYAIVDDPEINSIISWGESGDSFIIWDHLKFSAEILSKHFMHDRLSSFVIQLNNYGFRKIGIDHPWEYGNPEFQRGKPHLLKNIKRREPDPSRKRLVCHRMSAEIRNLQKAMNESKLEIKKLRSEQSDTQLRITALEERLKNAEKKEEELIQWCNDASKKAVILLDEDEGSA